MSKISILIAITLIFFGLVNSTVGQRTYQEEQISIEENLGILEEKIDKILSLLEEIESLKKLDLILRNQDKIMEELKIIKVRASR
jgi:hypothetical protein